MRPFSSETNTESFFAFLEMDYDSEDGPIPVMLNDVQNLCAPQMLQQLREDKKVVNGAPTGSGKTVVTYWMLQQLREIHGEDVELVVVHPSSLEANKTSIGPSTSPWTRESKKYNEDFISVTYDAIRGVTPRSSGAEVVYDVRGGTNMRKLSKIHECMSDPSEFEWYGGDEGEEKAKYGGDIDELDPDPEQVSYTNYCGLVVRKDIMKKRDREKKVKGNTRIVREPDAEYDHVFSPSKWWMQFCVKNIVLLVIDEIHHAKNDSVQNNALAALIRGVTRAAAMREDGASYFVCLTHTPMDKEVQAANYFKLFGLTNPVENNDMFITYGTRSVYQCFLEARLFNNKRATEIALDNKVIAKRTNNRYVEAKTTLPNPAKVTFQLWLECVLSKIQFVIVSMSPRQLWNGFFDIHSGEDRKLFREAHRRLKLSRAFAERDTSKSMRLMSEGGLLADAAMVGTIARVCIKGLTNHQERRFLLAFSLIESVDRCIAMLKSAGYGRTVVGRVAGTNQNLSSADKKRLNIDNATAIHNFQNDKIKVIVGTFAMLCTGLDLHDTIGERPRYTYFPAIYDITVEQQIAGRTARFGSRSVPQIFICYPKNIGSDIQKIYTSNINKSMVMTRTLEAIYRQGLSESDIKYYKSIIRLPGAYDRYIELPEGCEDMSFIWDYPMYIRKEDRYYPEEGRYGFIEEDTVEGRASYRSTAELIRYLEEICYDCEDVTKVPGIVFSTTLPSTLDPTAIDQNKT